MTFLLKFVAEYSRLIIGVLALSAICNCDKDFNLTFYNESKTWSEAKDFCFVNGGILETDEITIKNYTIEHVKLWLGAYSRINPWAGVFGCYFWNADDTIESIEFNLNNKEECQIRCPLSKYEFFVFQEKTCYCFNHDKLPHDDISPNKCSESTETDYVFIYKQNIETDIDGSDTDNCLVVDCRIESDTKTRFFTPKNCGSEYKALCDNMRQRPTITFYNTTKFCKNEGSYVKWDPSLSCKNSEEKFDSKHWTSITRSNHFFRLTVYDRNMTLNPLQCLGIETSEDLIKCVEPSAVKCSELRPFYCRTESRPLINGASNESPGDDVTMEMHDNGHITRYIIPGAIAGTTVLAIVVGVVIFVFRRRSAKRASNLKHDAHRPINTEDIGKLNNQNRYSYSEVKVEGSNQHDNEKDDADDQYTTGPSDVYDHLNENKNRKIKTENPHAIYDHSIGDNAEPDYDSTKHVVPANPDYQEVRI